MSSSIRNYWVIDLFAGAGGFGLGFQMASNQYKLSCSLEVDKWAAETLIANNADNHKIIQGDIRDFNTKEKILSITPVLPDIIIGGPPCQGFSVAGPPKDPKDPRNSLFRNYVEWVKILQPKIFVMENVRGLLTGRNESGEKVIDIITGAFRDIGYTVKVWELNAANYGVPQSRERIFVVGSRLGIEIPCPPITHYLPEEKAKLNGSARDLKDAVTVIQAIGDLPQLRAGEGTETVDHEATDLTEYQSQQRGTETKVYNHVTMSHTKRVVKR